MADVFTAGSDFYLLFEKEREKNERRRGGGVLRADNESAFDRRNNLKKQKKTKTNKEAKHRNKTANKTRKQFKCFAII